MLADEVPLNRLCAFVHRAYDSYQLWLWAKLRVTQNPGDPMPCVEDPVAVIPSLRHKNFARQQIFKSDAFCCRPSVHCFNSHRRPPSKPSRNWPSRSGNMYCSTLPLDCFATPGTSSNRAN